MTKLEALNQILNIIVESEKEGRTILEAINLTAQAYGGKGDSTNNAVAIKELYDIFTETKTQLTPANVKKGETVLGVEGDYHVADFKQMRYLSPPPGSANTNLGIMPWLKVLDFKNVPVDLKEGETVELSFFEVEALEQLYLTTIDSSKITVSFGDPSYSSWTLAIKELWLSDNWYPNDNTTSFDLSYLPSLTKESVLDVLNKLADRTATTNKPTLKLKSTVKSLLSEDEIKIATDKGWTVA